MSNDRRRIEFDHFDEVYSIEVDACKFKWFDPDHADGFDHHRFEWLERFDSMDELRQCFAHLDQPERATDRDLDKVIALLLFFGYTQLDTFRAQLARSGRLSKTSWPQTDGYTCDIDIFAALLG